MIDEPGRTDGSSPAVGAGAIRRLLQLSWHHREACLRAFALQLAVIALRLGALQCTGISVDVLRHEIDPSTPSPSWLLGYSPPDAWSIKLEVGLLGGLVLSMGICQAVAGYACGVESGRMQHLQIVPELRSRMYRKLQRLSLMYHERHGSASIINRLTTDVQTARSFVDSVILQGGIGCLTLLAYIAFMVHMHWGLALACLAVGGIVWRLTRRFSSWARTAYSKIRDQLDALVLCMTEMAQGIQVTKVFGREQECLRRFSLANQAVLEQQDRIINQSSTYIATVDAVSQFNVVVLFAYGGYLVFERDLTLGGLIVFASALAQFTAQVATIARLVEVLQQSVAGAERVFELLDAPIEICTPEQPVAPCFAPSAGKRGIVRFEGVSFAYAAGAAALENVSFELPTGSSLGIVGTTGAGKSTLVSLIPRWYDVDRGQVLVGGCDVRNLNLDELRRRIGIVPQETILFRGTIAANIAFGDPSSASEARVERAAHAAGADEFIQGLPGGYNFVLSEGGRNLSGGQRQRLALARAMFIEPQILILDDFTSALDATTESEVLTSVIRLMRGRSTLIVASRLSTVRFAEHILVLERGRLVEQGSHAELMAANGHYRRISLLQRYGEERVTSSDTTECA